MSTDNHKQYAISMIARFATLAVKLLIWIVAMGLAILVLVLLMGRLYGGLWQLAFIPIVVFVFFAAGWIMSNAGRNFTIRFNVIFFLAVLLIRIAILKRSHMDVTYSGITIYIDGNPTFLGVLIEGVIVSMSLVALLVLFHSSVISCRIIERIVATLKQ